jgi:hypothetical protein
MRIAVLILFHGIVQMCTSVQPSLKCRPVNHGKPPSSSRERAKQYGNTAALGEPEMAEEPKHLDTIKWPKGCATCGVMVNTTGWLFDHRLYCEKHKPVGSGGGNHTEGGSDGHSNASKEDKISTQSNDAKCDLCGQWYHGQEGGMFYNAEHEAYRVCAFCQRVILCQAHAKCAGFWVVAKRPRTEEAKA